MVRLQLHLTPEQDRALRRLAKARRTTRAALIRKAVDILLAQASGDLPDPILGLIGQAGPLGDPRASETVDEVVYGYGPEPRHKHPRVAEKRSRSRK